jgi:uncharacterized protein DUF998
MPNTKPVPHVLVRRLWLGLGGAALFTAVAALQGAVRLGYDARQQSVSALSLGPGGWIQQLNFVLFGALLVSTVPALRTILRGGVAARSYPTLTMISGLALMILGFISQDPAPGYDPEQLGLALPTVLGLTHLVLAGVAMLGSVAGLFVMAARFARDPNWTTWVRPTQLVAAFAIVCVAVYAVWSTRPAGFAGVFERLAILATPVWALAFAWRLGSGVPFMIVTDDDGRF